MSRADFRKAKAQGRLSQHSNALNTTATTTNPLPQSSSETRTMGSHATPPPRFRADQIGSLLRPQYLLDAQNAILPFAAMHNNYNPDADSSTIAAVHAAEKRAITDVVREQVDRGITPISSGEFARASFVSGFFEKLNGVEIRFTTFAENFRTGFPIIRPYARRGIEGRHLPIAVGKVRWRESAYLGEWKVVRDLLPRERWGEVKVTIPSPAWTAVQVRDGEDNKAWVEGVYEGKGAEEEYLKDCGEAVRREILALYEEGW